jgi:VanZ family protein
MKSIFRARPEAEELRNRTAGWRQVGVWLPCAVMMMVIACESTNTFSAENTSGWLRPVFERIFGHVSDGFWGVLHYSIRKSGHFTGYGILSLTWLRAWLLTLGRKSGLAVWKWRLQSFLLAVLSTFCVGGLDEWHQTSIPSRTGMFSDVLIDTAGGFMACLAVALLFWIRLGRRGSKPVALAVGD